MKIVYCIHSTCNSGGMERVLCNKANYLVEHLGYEVYIITTEQKGRESFFQYSPKIHFVDFAINYSDISGSFMSRIFKQNKKVNRHKMKMESFLYQIRPDIVISMYYKEIAFLWKINDGSRKILEIHFSRKFKVQSYSNNLLLSSLYYIRSLYELRFIKKFDKFIVLTKEDKDLWGNLSNIEVIPNACWFEQYRKSDLSQKEVISVGRLSFQKGFDRLLKAWAKVNQVCPQWRLNIWGSGEMHDSLLYMIKELDISSSVIIHAPTLDIQEEYLKNSIFVMSSRFEGMPMAMLEALSFGLPIVSFACQCGPSDIVTNGLEGYLVKEGNIDDLADKLVDVIQNESKRKYFAENAFSRSKDFQPAIIMDKWNVLFKSLLSNNSSKAF